MKASKQTVARVLRVGGLWVVAACGLSGCAIDHIRQLREAEQTFRNLFGNTPQVINNRAPDCKVP